MATSLRGIGGNADQTQRAAGSASSSSITVSNNLMDVTIPESSEIGPQLPTDAAGEMSSFSLSRQTTRIVYSTDDEDDSDHVSGDVGYAAGVSDRDSEDDREDEKDEFELSFSRMTSPGDGSLTSGQLRQQQRRRTIAGARRSVPRPPAGRALSQAEIKEQNRQERERQTVSPNEMIRDWLGVDARTRRPNPGISGPMPRQVVVPKARRVGKLQASSRPKLSGWGAGVGLLVGGILGAAVIGVAATGVGLAVGGAILVGAMVAGGVTGAAGPSFRSGHRQQKTHLLQALRTLQARGDRFELDEADRLAAVTDEQWRRLLHVPESQVADRKGRQELRTTLVRHVATYGYASASQWKADAKQQLEVPEDRVQDPAQRKKIQLALSHMAEDHDPIEVGEHKERLLDLLEVPEDRVQDPALRQKIQLALIDRAEDHDLTEVGAYKQRLLDQGLLEVTERRVPDPAQREKIQLALIRMGRDHDLDDVREFKQGLLGPDREEVLKLDDLDQIIARRYTLRRDLGGPDGLHICGPSNERLRVAIAEALAEAFKSTHDPLKDFNRTASVRLVDQDSESVVSRTGTPRTNERMFHRSMSKLAGGREDVAKELERFTGQTVPNSVTGAIEGQLRVGSLNVIVASADRRDPPPVQRTDGVDAFILDFETDVGFNRLDVVRQDPKTRKSKHRGWNLDPAQARLSVSFSVRMTSNNLLLRNGKFTFVGVPRYEMTWPEHSQ